MENAGAASTVVVPPPATELPTTDRYPAARRWHHLELFEGGFLSVPTKFFQCYNHLTPFCLTPNEALLVLHIMSFKWDEKAPFPTYKTLAWRIGISEKRARRLAKSLEAKKLIRRVTRIGRSNAFDLTPLFDALRKASVTKPPTFEPEGVM